MTGLYDRIPTFEDKRLEGVPVNNPFVTVIVTCYNYEPYIENCLRSIAAQTYEHFKCVVVDDCSTDGSVDIIKKFIDSDEAGGKFSLVSTGTNGGQMAAFKRGLNEVEGPFTVLVDADDMLLNDFIQTHLAHHLADKVVAFTSSNQYQINELGEIIGGNHQDLQYRVYRHIHSLPLYNPFWLWATTSSMMFRTSILQLIMPDNAREFTICADNYLVHFANLLGGSLLISTIHGCYRRHGKNCFGSNPVIGGHLPVGDMDKHPKHDIVRKTILKKLLNHYKYFYPLFSNSGFWDLVRRTALPGEIGKMYDDYPHIFKRSKWYYMKGYLAYRTKLRTKTLKQKLARPKPLKTI